jgi:hypothetical protein
MILCHVSNWPSRKDSFFATDPSARPHETPDRSAFRQPHSASRTAPQTPRIVSLRSSGSETVSTGRISLLIIFVSTPSFRSPCARAKLAEFTPEDNSSLVLPLKGSKLLFPRSFSVRNSVRLHSDLGFFTGAIAPCRLADRKSRPQHTA